jgi:hypothetical protein
MYRYRPKFGHVPVQGQGRIWPSQQSKKTYLIPKLYLIPKQSKNLNYNFVISFYGILINQSNLTIP